MRVIPSAKGQRTPDLVVEYADGRAAERWEISAATSAPGGRVSVRPTEFPDGKTSKGGLTKATAEKLPDLESVKAAVKRKAVGSNLQVSVPIAGVPAGGRVIIDLPFGSTDPALLQRVMAETAEDIHADVKAITFVVRVQEEGGATGSRYVTWQRSGPTSFTPLPPSSSPVSARPGAARGASTVGPSTAATGKPRRQRSAPSNRPASSNWKGRRTRMRSTRSRAPQRVASNARPRKTPARWRSASCATAPPWPRKKRGASFAPVIGWVFAAQDINTGLQDMAHGNVALGAATIAVAVDAESDSIHLGDAVTDVGGTALSLTIQGWATAMQISFEQHRVGVRGEELRAYIQKNGKLPPADVLQDYYKLNHEESMLLANDISGFGRKQMVTAALNWEPGRG